MTEKDSALLRRKPLALANLTGFVLRVRHGLYPKTNPAEKGYQTAQGMVEFALVLPILLLIIFGIIAFGHLFFTYSLVVNASREAARMGSAVGLSEHSIPHFRDCDEIRDHAVRVGTFAGVENTEASVQIAYDKGPKLDGTDADVYGDVEVDGVENGIGYGCPEGGVGPGMVGLGDRIEVTVSVNYEPIVPLVPIPSFPLTAVSRRTIVLGMPVGDTDMAEAPPCTSTITRIIPPTWRDTTTEETASISQAWEDNLTFHIEVISDDPDNPAQGTVYLFEEVDTYDIAQAVCSGAAPYYQCSYEHLWGVRDPDLALPQFYTVRASFVPVAPLVDGTCWEPSRAEPVPHTVNPAETITSIELPIEPSTSEQNKPVRVEVRVEPVAPGGGFPSNVATYPPGRVNVSDGHGNSCDISLNVVPIVDGPNIAEGACDLTLTNLGSNTITAVYDPGNENRHYNSSQATITHTVEAPVAQCPYFAPSASNLSSQINFSAVAPIMELTFRNVGSQEVRINSIQIRQTSPEPTLNTSPLLESVEFSITAEGTSSELWIDSSVEQTFPLPQTIYSDPSAKWTIPGATSSVLSIEFSHTPGLISGYAYEVTINYNNSGEYLPCIPQVRGTGTK